MNLGFGDALLVVGVLLAVAAALSGLMRGTVLSISVLSVVAGIVLAETGVVSVTATSPGIVDVIELALILTLFSDGLFVERELLRLHWGPVTRAIVVAMPITLGLLALIGHSLFGDLSWAEAFLLAAVLTPTDPVVTSTVVTAQRVPAIVRHTLNLESGLNDGLALPFVLFFLALAGPAGDAGTEAAKVLGEAAFGAVVGVVVGIVGGRLHHYLPGGGITRRYEGI
jgi:NhaP-type Na+/H+ or K+/H+ antiporter